MNALQTAPTATFFQASPKANNPARLSSFWRRLNQPRPVSDESHDQAIFEPRTTLSDTVAEALRWYTGQDAR